MNEITSDHFRWEEYGRDYYEPSYSNYVFKLTNWFVYFEGDFNCEEEIVDCCIFAEFFLLYISKWGFCAIAVCNSPFFCFLDRRSSSNNSKTKEWKQKSPSPKFFIEMDSSDSLLPDEDSMIDEEKNEKNSNVSDTDHRLMVEAKCDLKVGLKGEVNDEKSKMRENSTSRVHNWNCEVKKAFETIGPNIRKAVAKKTTRSILFQRLANTKRGDCDDDGVDGDDDDDDEDDDDDCNRDAVVRSRSGVNVNVAPRVVEILSDLNPGKTFTSPRSSTGKRI